MQCHPDKGGDKAEFQELHEAYEKIMEQRRSSANLEPASEVREKSKEKRAPYGPYMKQYGNNIYIFIFILYLIYI